jgi:antitoxin component YwqK of YwqJK toxin-antitoxin module
MRYMFSATRYAAKAAPKTIGAVFKIAKKPSKREDYVETKNLYIAKSLILAVILIIIALALFIWFIGYPFMVSKFFTIRIWEDDAKLQKYDGRVIVTYDEERENPKVKTKLDDGLPIETAVVYDENGLILYEGGFENWQFSAIGTLYNEGCLVYKGGFNENLKSGEGVEYFPNGEVKYDGTFVNDVYSGTGREYSNTGDLVYSGDFAGGLFNGQGNYYKNASTVIVGTFENDCISGDASLMVSGKLAYKGTFEGFSPGGYGTVYDIDSQKPLFTGFFDADGIVLEQFGDFSVEDVRAAFPGAAEDFEGYYFSIADANTGLKFFCTINYQASEARLISVYKHPGKVNSLIQSQTGDAWFGISAGVSGSSSGGSGADYNSGAGFGNGEAIEAAIRLVGALDDLIIAEDEDTESDDEQAVELFPLTELLGNNELNVETLSTVLNAIAEYVRDSTQLQALSAKLDIKKAELTEAENDAKAGGDEKLPDSIKSMIESIESQISDCMLKVKRSEIVISNLTELDIKNYKETDALFEGDYQLLDLTAMTEKILDNAALDDFKLKTLDLAIAKNNLDLARENYSQALAALQLVKRSFTVGDTNESDINNAACNVLDSYSQLFSAFADYSKTIVEINILSYGWISETFDWLKDDFTLALELTFAEKYAEETAAAEEEAKKAADEAANAPLPVFPEVSVPLKETEISYG